MHVSRRGVWNRAVTISFLCDLALPDPACALMSPPHAIASALTPRSPAEAVSRVDPDHSVIHSVIHDQSAN
jgi:hypothetical protein